MNEGELIAGKFQIKRSAMMNQMLYHLVQELRRTDLERNVERYRLAKCAGRNASPKHRELRALLADLYIKLVRHLTGQSAVHNHTASSQA